MNEFKWGRYIGGFFFLAVSLWIAVVSGYWLAWTAAFLVNLLGVVFDLSVNGVK